MLLLAYYAQTYAGIIGASLNICIIPPLNDGIKLPTAPKKSQHPKQQISVCIYR